MVRFSEFYLIRRSRSWIAENLTKHVNWLPLAYSMAIETEVSLKM